MSKKELSHESKKFGLHATLARIEEQRQYQERTELKQKTRSPNSDQCK